jgi:hypothetical protein
MTVPLPCCRPMSRTVFCKSNIEYPESKWTEHRGTITCPRGRRSVDNFSKSAPDEIAMASLPPACVTGTPHLLFE